jgi:hypothetical protein
VRNKVGIEMRILMTRQEYSVLCIQIEVNQCE